jgi:hypothetical protein
MKRAIHGKTPPARAKARMLKAEWTITSIQQKEQSNWKFSENRDVLLLVTYKGTQWLTDQPSVLKSDRDGENAC